MGRYWRINTSYDQQEGNSNLGCIEQQMQFGLSEWSCVYPYLVVYLIIGTISLLYCYRVHDRVHIYSCVGTFVSRAYTLDRRHRQPIQCLFRRTKTNWANRNYSSFPMTAVSLASHSLFSCGLRYCDAVDTERCFSIGTFFRVLRS